MIPRLLAKTLAERAKKFPIVSVLGPRQTGKTTLVKSVFSKKPYVNLENLDTRSFAERDPRGFLKQYPKGAILDEVQRVPSLFSYLQTRVDEDRQNGQFILTGSEHFLLHEKISQTLAGRVAILYLLPLSYQELLKVHKNLTLHNLIFSGGYPRLYQEHLGPVEWYPDYLHTYLERDVRQIKNITDLGVFQRFLGLCAGRIGQLLNLSSLAIECGVSHNTIRSWIHVLEAGFVITLLQPHFKNFGKRLVKMPKLYFTDTGVACSLLGIETSQQLQTHYLRGALFENWVVAECIKGWRNKGKEPRVWFWRDQHGHEIDLLIDRGGELIPIEIKSGATIRSDNFANLEYWRKLAKTASSSAYLVYGGDESQKGTSVTVLSWKQIAKITAR